MLVRFGGILFLVALAVWLYCLLDAITADRDTLRALRKGVWIAVVVLTFEVGAIAWLIWGGRATAAPRRDPAPARVQRAHSVAGAAGHPAAVRAFGRPGRWPRRRPEFLARWTGRPPRSTRSCSAAGRGPAAARESCAAGGRRALRARSPHPLLTPPRPPRGGPVDEQAGSGSSRLPWLGASLLLLHGLLVVLVWRFAAAPQRRGPQPRPRFVAPDDDPDFLRDLDRRTRRDDEQP